MPYLPYPLPYFYLPAYLPYLHSLPYLPTHLLTYPLSYFYLHELCLISYLLASLSIRTYLLICLLIIHLATCLCTFLLTYLMFLPCLNSLVPCSSRQVDQLLQIAKQKQTANKRQRGADAPSASGGEAIDEEVQQLTSEYQLLEDRVFLATELLGEGKTKSGWVADLGPRGIAVRCALAVKKARGKDPNPNNHASASGVVCGTCVYDTRIGQCLVRTHLAVCYYCSQQLCPEHRILIAGGREKEGKRRGGATCCCLDRGTCKVLSLIHI